MTKEHVYRNIVSWLLRAGLALVFLYAAISSLQNPFEWVGFLPPFIPTFVSPVTLIQWIAYYEVFLVIWLISGKFMRYAALVCGLTLLAVVITNLGQLITTFRDIGLVFMAAALFFSSEYKKTS